MPKHRQVQRTIERSEGVGGHARARHAGMLPRDLIDRLAGRNGQRAVDSASTFADARSQDTAVTAVLRGHEGELATFREGAHRGERAVYTGRLSGSIQGVAAEVIDRRAHTFTYRRGLVRAAAVVVESEGRGRYKVITAYPTDFHFTDSTGIESTWS